MKSASGAYWRNEKYYGGFCLIQSIERGASGELVAALIATYPDAVKQKDGKGRLPLVVAIESKSEFAVIDSLVTAFPGALKLPYLRKIPIHMAVEVGACVRSVRIAHSCTRKQQTEGGHTNNCIHINQKTSMRSGFGTLHWLSS